MALNNKRNIRNGIESVNKFLNSPAVKHFRNTLIFCCIAIMVFLNVSMFLNFKTMSRHIDIYDHPSGAESQFIDSISNRISLYINKYKMHKEINHFMDFDLFLTQNRVVVAGNYHNDVHHNMSNFQSEFTPSDFYLLSKRWSSIISDSDLLRIDHADKHTVISIYNYDKKWFIVIKLFFEKSPLSLLPANFSQFIAYLYRVDHLCGKLYFFPDKSAMDKFLYE